MFIPIFIKGFNPFSHTIKEVNLTIDLRRQLLFLGTEYVIDMKNKVAYKKVLEYGHKNKAA